MINRNKDIRNVLKYYVTRSSAGETEIADKLNQAVVLTDNRLSPQISFEFADTEASAPSLSTSNDTSPSVKHSGVISINSRDQRHPSLSNSDPHISYGQSKSLEDTHADQIRDARSATSKSIVDQSKHISTINSLSYNSLPSSASHSINKSKSLQVHSKKTNKPKSLRSVFSLHKKKKGHDVDLTNIDRLAAQQIIKYTESKTEARPLSSGSSRNQDVSSKGSKVRRPLQEMKKKRKIPGFLKNMLPFDHTLSKNGIWPHKSDHFNRNDHIETKKKDSMKDQETKYRVKGTKIEDTHHMPTTNGSDDVFGVAKMDAQPKRSSCPVEACDCDDRRFELISKNLMAVWSKQNTEEIVHEIEQFDNRTFHFKNCKFNDLAVLSLRKDSHSSSTHSHLSLYQSCEYCNNVDEQLHPSISTHLLPVIHTLEDGDEINFNDDHLNFFLSVKCYAEFEEGMRQSIGVECSIRSLAYLHYVTRKIVRHIGDPKEEENEQIRQIMHYAEKYCIDHFSSVIEAHGSLEEFLKQCTQNDID